jgi:hypothetical protein
MVGMALSQIIGNNHSARPNTVLKQKKVIGPKPRNKTNMDLITKRKAYLADPKTGIHYLIGPQVHPGAPTHPFQEA